MKHNLFRYDIKTQDWYTILKRMTKPRDENTRLELGYDTIRTHWFNAVLRHTKPKHNTKTYP